MEGGRSTKGGKPFRNLRNFLFKRSCGIRIRKISTSRHLRDAYEYEREKFISNRMTQQLQRCPKVRKRRFVKYSRKTRTELKAERKKILQDNFMILSKPLPSAMKSKPSSSRVPVISISTPRYFVQRSGEKIQALSDSITPQRLQISTTKKSRFSNFFGRWKQQSRYVRSKSRLIVGALKDLKAKARLSRHAQVQQNQVAGSSRNVRFNRDPIHSRRRLEDSEKVHPQTTRAKSMNVGHGACSSFRIHHRYHQVGGSTRSRSFHRNSSKSFSASGDSRHPHSSCSSEGSSHSFSAVYKQRFRYKAFGKSWISWLRSWRCKYYRRESCFGGISLSLLRLWRR